MVASLWNELCMLIVKVENQVSWRFTWQKLDYGWSLYLCGQPFDYVAYVQPKNPSPFNLSPKLSVSDAFFVALSKKISDFSFPWLSAWASSLRWEGFLASFVSLMLHSISNMHSWTTKIQGIKCCTANYILGRRSSGKLKLEIRMAVALLWKLSCIYPSSSAGIYLKQ